MSVRLGISGSLGSSRERSSPARSAPRSSSRSDAHSRFASALRASAHSPARSAPRSSLARCSLAVPSALRPSATEQLGEPVEQVGRRRAGRPPPPGGTGPRRPGRRARAAPRRRCRSGRRWLTSTAPNSVSIGSESGSAGQSTAKPWLCAVISTLPVARSCDRLVDARGGRSAACRCRSRRPVPGSGCRSRCRRSAPRRRSSSRTSATALIGGGRIARPVGQEHRVGTGGQHLLDRLAGWQHVAGDAALGHPVRGHRLDAVVHRGDREPVLAERVHPVGLRRAHLAGQVRAGHLRRVAHLGQQRVRDPARSRRSPPASRRARAGAWSAPGCRSR